MPEPSLTIWLLGFPLIVAVVDLVRTFSALKNRPVSSASPRGSWSQATHATA